MNTLLNRCLGCCFIVIATLSSSHAKSPTPNIILCIGQSNMAGRAPIPKDAMAPLKRVLLLNGSGEWEPAKAPLNIYSTIRKEPKMQKLGIAYSFAQSMTKKYNKATFGLVHNARGGSPIKEWQKGKKHYSAAMARLALALKQGRLIGVIWHQGESDSGNKNYQADLKKFITTLRTELKRPKLPVIIGEVLQERALPRNADMKAYADTDPFCTLVKATDLRRYDFAHFDAPSQTELGKRYAKALMDLLPKNAIK